VWREARDYLEADVPVGPHLADQIMLPLGIAAQSGRGGAFRTNHLTHHATTHLEILRKFLGVDVDVEPSAEGTSLVRIR
jgi:RNA 3'-terminal phosphate cyclase (ATP)